MPVSAQLNSQQQKMKDCYTQASGMSADARNQFMSSCLSGTTAEGKEPHCINGSRVAIPASPRRKSVISPKETVRESSVEAALFRLTFMLCSDNKNAFERRRWAFFG
jgi:hypothetical protein